MKGEAGALELFLNGQACRLAGFILFSLPKQPDSLANLA